MCLISPKLTIAGRGGQLSTKAMSPGTLIKVSLVLTTTPKGIVFSNMYN